MSENELTMVSYRIPVELLASLDELAARLDRPRTRLFHEACRDLLMKYESRRIESQPESEPLAA